MTGTAGRAPIREEGNVGEPVRVDRPWMPGYGVTTGDEGLLPWSWAVERLQAARRYWVSSASAAGEPHVSAVWAAWVDDALWFSCGGRSRKARNLLASGRCAIATERADESVTLTGPAERVVGERALAPVREAYVAKYGEGFPDPATNPVFAVRPERVIGIVEDESHFASAATRWVFGDPASAGGGLAGRRLRLRYASGLEMDALYGADDVSWHALAGPTAGQRGSEATAVSEVRPGVWFVSWVEDGATVSQVLDLDHGTVVGFVTYPDGPARAGALDHGTITPL